MDRKECRIDCPARMYVRCIGTVGAVDAGCHRLAEQKRPFLLATYVLGTHVGLDSPDVKYDDGKNSFLNKFYNQDYWLGAFLQKFDASAFAKDTILVFTSDHATYPGRDFTELFGEYDYFVGEMPLIFYNKFIMPAKKDAGGLNSLASFFAGIINL